MIFFLLSFFVLQAFKKTVYHHGVAGVTAAYQGGEGGSEVQLEEEKEQVVAEWHLVEGVVVKEVL